MHHSTKDGLPQAARLGRCHYGPCQCRVPAPELYCSEQCRQAAAQGIERDYCQCEHEATWKPSRTLPAAELFPRKGW